jgi:hypothetical protein
VRVLNVAGEELGAGVEKDGAHEKRTSNVERPTSNVEVRRKPLGNSAFSAGR